MPMYAGYGEEPLVQAFWSRHRTVAGVEQVSTQGWDLVLARNFSMYGNRPRASSTC